MHAGADADGAGVWCGCYPDWEWVAGGVLVVVVVCAISFCSFVVGCLFTKYIDGRFQRDAVVVPKPEPPAPAPAPLQAHAQHAGYALRHW